MTATFDPAAWLAKAEAAGYDIKYVQPSGGIWFGEPPTHKLSSDTEVALWREYRPDDVTAAINSKALARHLMLSRRITFDHQPPLDVRGSAW